MPSVSMKQEHSKGLNVQRPFREADASMGLARPWIRSLHLFSSQAIVQGMEDVYSDVKRSWLGAALFALEALTRLGISRLLSAYLAV